MAIWQPRSLQQLVLISIFAALVPGSLAIWFTVDTLRQLSDKSLQIAQTVVDATRLGQEIQRDVLELERRARQYLALSDFELAELFERERDILSGKLAALQASIPSPSPDIKGLKGSLGKLALPLAPDDIEADAADAIANQADRMDHEFSVINDQSKAVKTWLLASVDQLLEANAREAESLIDNLRIELSLLAAATLALLLFLAY
ncbi:MAG: hypothetical protein R3228_11025, partial [Halioglobus sp.]|nr:hypothetical protein [Halioglobus sp.]